MIDFSQIQTNQPSQDNETEWEAPPHKFFGAKDARGKTEKEPTYVYREYPRMVYGLVNDVITARIVGSEHERKALGDGWENNPAAFGHIGAPSFEQHIAMQNKSDAEIVDAPKRGRPKA